VTDHVTALFTFWGIADMAMALVNKLRTNVFRITTALTSTKTQSCVRYNGFIGFPVRLHVIFKQMFAHFCSPASHHIIYKYKYKYK